MFLREGVRPHRASSTLVFFALVALTVVTMSIVALAITIPPSEWALIQG